MPAAKVHDEASALDPSSACSTGSPYQRLLYSLHHDQKCLTELNLGKRVGFYRFRGELGSGNFSQVKMAIHQLTKEQVAIKILDKAKLDQKTRRMLAREIATMESIHHPNIIRLYEVVETYSRIYLVMEYARGGELFNKITTLGKFSEPEAQSLFAQVVSAVEYMHENNFIHRDIKAENVFYAGPGLVKLGDFGFSTQLNMGQDQQLNTFCGSPPYAAPELFRDESYVGAPVDVWALGVLLYFMVTAQMPFKAQTVATLKKHILDGIFSTPTHVSPSCKKVIEGILKQTPSDRFSLREIHRSDWLSGADFPITPGPTESIRLSEIETQTREKLSQMGVTETMLEENVPRGVRSAVVGMYHILVHRLQRRGQEEPDDDLDGCSQATSTTASSSNHFCLSSLGRRTKSAAVKSRRSNRNHHSRTCTVL